MMKKLLILLIALAALFVGCPQSQAQSGYTQVTGKVLDPTGNAYVGCKANISFVPSPTATTVPLIYGSTFTTTIPIVNCDSFGNFPTMSIVDNLQVSDGHTGSQASQWQFNVTSQNGLTAFSCKITITGTSQVITSQIQACAAPLPSTGGGSNLASTAVGFGAPNNTLTGDANHFYFNSSSYLLTVVGGVNIPAAAPWNGTTGSNVALKGWGQALYADPHGSDSNDGYSAGSPMGDIRHAVCSLPGGNCANNVAGSGTVYFTDSTPATSVSGGGLCFMSSLDPNYANPSGTTSCAGQWLTTPSNWGGVAIIGIPYAYYGPNDHKPKALIVGGSSADLIHPTVWLSGTNKPILIQNSAIQYPGRGVIVGLCSNGTDATGTCVASTDYFDNDTVNLNIVAGNGPAWYITGGSFWQYFTDCGGAGTDSVNGSSSLLSPAFFFDGGTNVGDDLIFMKDINTEAGNITFKPGSAGGSISKLDGYTEEAPYGEAAVAFIENTSYPGAGQYVTGNVQNVYVADPVSGSSGASVDPSYINAGLVASIKFDNINGSGAPNITGPAQIDVQQSGGLAYQTKSPESQGQYGFWNGHVTGINDATWRNGMLHPVPYTNLIAGGCSTWYATQFAGTTTKTCGVTDLWGGTNAGTASSTSATTENLNFPMCGSPSSGVCNVNLSVGEVLVGEFVWKGNATFLSSNPAITVGGSGFAGNETCYGASVPGTSGWSKAEKCIYIVTAVGTNPAAVAFGAVFNTTSVTAAYPVFNEIPSSVDLNEVYSYFYNLAPYDYTCPSGGWLCTVNLPAYFTNSVTSPEFESSSANIATAGALRLANTDTIDWQNVTDSGNLPLGVSTGNNLTFGGNALVPLTNASPVGGRCLQDVLTGSVITMVEGTAACGGGAFSGGSGSSYQYVVGSSTPPTPPSNTIAMWYSGSAFECITSSNVACPAFFGPYSGSSNQVIYENSTAGAMEGNANFVFESGSTPEFPNGYYDVAEIAAPSNPSSGLERWFASSSTHTISCLTSTGGNCAPSGGSGTPGGSSGQLQWNSASAFAGVSGSAVTTHGGLLLGPGIDTPVLQLRPYTGAVSDVFDAFSTNAVSAPSSPSYTTVSGGSLSSRTYYIKVAYLDWSGVLTTASSEVHTSTLAANTLFQMSSPAALSNQSAAAYLPEISTTTGTETVMAVTSSNCTLATGLPESAVAACAIGAAYTEPTTGFVSGTTPPSSNLTEVRSFWVTSGGNPYVLGPWTVAAGGTGLQTLSAHGVLIGEGTSPIDVVTGSTAGYVLTWNSSGDPSFQANTSSSLFASFQVGSSTAITTSGTYIQFTATAPLTIAQTGAGTSISPYIATYAINAATTSAQGSIQMDGDLAGSGATPEVTGLLSNALPSLAAGYLNWTGSAWALSAIPTVTASPQFQMAFYDASGTQSSVEGSNNLTTDNSGDFSIGLLGYTSAITDSPYLQLSGSYENASTPTYAQDEWEVRNVIGSGLNGTSTLVFAHSGTSGTLGFDLSDAGAMSTVLTLGPTSSSGGNILGLNKIVCANGTTAQCILQVGGASGSWIFLNSSGNTQIQFGSGGQVTELAEEQAPTNNTGTPYVLYGDDATSQTGSISSTNMFTTKSTSTGGVGAGLYVVEGYLVCHTGQSGTTVTVTLTWNDGIASQSVNPYTSSGTVISLVACTTTGTIYPFSQTLYSATSEAIAFSTTASGFTTGSYDLHIRLKTD